MKKTLTVNLNSIVFHIDDDAYEMLQTYLSEIARHFESDEEKKEIMSDIEARIAELFTEKLQKNKNVVTLEDVQEIIEIMGKPSQYAGEDEENEAPKTDKKQQKSRRFYRDPENAILGGIAGGLAAYFGWDVTLIRILIVVAAIVSIGFVIPIIYIVVWFVAPAAVTASQRLEMQGEDVTVESIKAEMNNVKNYVESDKFKQSASTFGEKIFEILRWSFKLIFGFVGAILGFVGLVLVAVLVFLLFMVIFEPASINNFAPGLISNWAVFTPENAAMFIISLLLVVGCPIFMLIYWGIRFANGRKDSSKTASWVVLILWLAGLFMFYSVGAKTFVNLQSVNGQPISINWNDEDTTKVDEIRNVEPFTTIEISGNIELILNQDSVQSVQITASPYLQPKIITKVENGVLKIYTDQIFINSILKANISTNLLESIVAKGACSITTESQLLVPKLTLELLGASKADMDVKVAGLFNVDIKGASEAIFTGTSQTLKLKALGASKINAEDLIAKNVEVYVAGASHATLFATDSIDATAYGASEIDCKGSPKSIKQKDGGASSISIE